MQVTFLSNQKSRNYIGLLNAECVANDVIIYNSRNYIGLLNIRKDENNEQIYNSRNYIGLLNPWIRPVCRISTIVEII